MKVLFRSMIILVLSVLLFLVIGTASYAQGQGHIVKSGEFHIVVGDQRYPGKYLAGEFAIWFNDPNVLSLVYKVAVDDRGDEWIDSLKTVTVSSVPKTGVPSLDSLNEKYGLKLIARKIEPFRFLFSLDTDIISALQEYKRLPFVAYAEPAGVGVADFDDVTALERITWGKVKKFIAGGAR